MVTHLSYWSHTHPTGPTPILLVTHLSYWSQTHPTGHTPILMVTHLSYWSQTHPTGHTPILLVTNPPYWLYTCPTGYTRVVTKPSYWSNTHPTLLSLIDEPVRLLKRWPILHTVVVSCGRVRLIIAFIYRIYWATAGWAWCIGAHSSVVQGLDTYTQIPE